MAEQTHYSTSEITPLLHNETNPRPSEFLDSLTIPNSTSFLGERNEEDELFEGFWRQSAKKRRHSANQVQFLEKNFEVENKLEPDRKIQLAKELGLQPKQVAIWFQNRRARCKTKQLEKDYASLKTSYQNLKSNFESLFHEREKLKTEIQILKEKLGIPEEGSLAKSAVPDSSSENHNSSMAGSSHEFEPELSDCFSHDEEENLSRNLLPICFPKWETCYYEDQPTEACCNLNGFQFEDQALDFWPY